MARSNVPCFLFVLVMVCLGCGCYSDRWVITEQYHPAWTPEGSIVYLEIETSYLSESTVFHEGLWHERRWFLCEMNSDGTEKRRLSEIYHETQGLSGGWPYTSVDSKGRICISRHGMVFELCNGEMWLANRNGLPIRKIADSASCPSLSPDGRKVAFEKDGRGVWIADLASRKTRPLIESAELEMPSWTPDGMKIAMISGGKELCVYDMEMDSLRKLWRIPDPLRCLQFPQWNIDGTKVICLALRNLIEVEIDSPSDPDTIQTSLAVLLSHPRISPDGSALIGDGASIYRAHISGAKKEVLTRSSIRKTSFLEHCGDPF